MNFEKARENCKQKGWKLFEPMDFVELREVSKFPGYNDFKHWDFMWIGITDIASEGNYVYDSNGKSITLNPRWTNNTSSLEHRAELVAIVLLLPIH